MTKQTMRKLISRTAIILLISAAILGVLLYEKQTELIFAELQSPSTPLLEVRKEHPDLVRVPLTTKDGKSLEVWKLPANTPPKGEMKVGVFFRGNGGPLEGFMPEIEFMRSFGITAYYFNYRGYGESTGYPSEEGIYEDARSVVLLALRETNADPTELLLFGLSVGTGPAAYAAKKFTPRALILVAPYSSIDDVVRFESKFWLLAPLLSFHFPVAENLGRLPDTCVIVAAGKLDNVLSWHNTERIAAHTTAKKLTVLYEDKADHGTIFWQAKPGITRALNECNLAGS